MTNKWHFKSRGYLHFDGKIVHENQIKHLILNPEKVSKHPFLPFIQDERKNRKFSKYLEKKKLKKTGGSTSALTHYKTRPIKYASHKDAQLFSYYRHQLSILYEQKLLELGLSKNVIAYRKIPEHYKSNKGKCNIHFAKEAFDEIVKKKNVTVLTFDIEGFFESLEHKFLKRKWADLLNKRELPVDHLALFKAITYYSFVEKRRSYKALQVGSKLQNRKKILCSKEEYRNLIVRNGLVQKNKNKKGIPQGSPIADILSNLYMIDFDFEMKMLEKKYEGYYRRYSDDILFICPHQHANTIEKSLEKIIKKQGQGSLKINAKKTKKTIFYEKDKLLFYKKSTLNYLGFSFDGRKALLATKTLSRYKRKTVQKIYSFIGKACKKAKIGGKPLKNNLNISMLFHNIYYADKSWRDEKTGQKKMNFMTYVLRAERIFNQAEDRNYSFSKIQLKDHKKWIKKQISKNINHHNTRLSTKNRSRTEK